MPSTPRSGSRSDSRSIEIPAHSKVEDIMADGGSLNDAAWFREQDQAIAQLGTQIDNMVGSPWEPVAVSEMYSADCAHHSSPIRRVAQQLGCMSVTPAVVGSQNSIVGHGTLAWVSMGNRHVSVPMNERAKLLKRLNDGYSSIVAPRRAALIKSIFDYAKAGEIEAAPASAEYTHALRAGKTFVACANETDLKALQRQLTADYTEAIQDALNAVMTELMRAAKPTVGPDGKDSASDA